jgi:hypothetical protein
MTVHRSPRSTSETTAGYLLPLLWAPRYIIRIHHTNMTTALALSPLSAAASPTSQFKGWCLRLGSLRPFSTPHYRALTHDPPVTFVDLIKTNNILWNRLATYGIVTAELRRYASWLSGVYYLLCWQLKFCFNSISFAIYTSTFSKLLETYTMSCR